MSGYQPSSAFASALNRNLLLLRPLPLTHQPHLLLLRSLLPHPMSCSRLVVTRSPTATGQVVKPNLIYHVTGENGWLLEFTKEYQNVFACVLQDSVAKLERQFGTWPLWIHCEALFCCCFLL